MSRKAHSTRTAPKRPSTAARPSRGGRLRTHLATHRQAAVDSLRRLLGQPLASLMTASVIGIALLLPALLLIAIHNLSQFGGDLRQVAQLSAYLQDGVEESQARALQQQLQADPRIHDVDYISPTQAAREFAEVSGFGDVLAMLPENPLPGVLLLQPSQADSDTLRQLQSALEAEPQVALVQLDLLWVQRLDSLLQLAQRVAAALLAVLALAVLFTVGNTIRLAIANRTAEIRVVKLVGGTDSFVARPFLYTGLWFGLAGGALAWLLLSLLLWLLSAPLDRLLTLYDSDFILQAPTLPAIAALLAGSALLGWLGARLSVHQYLRQIEPH